MTSSMNNVSCIDEVNKNMHNQDFAQYSFNQHITMISYIGLYISIQGAGNSSVGYSQSRLISISNLGNFDLRINALFLYFSYSSTDQSSFQPLTGQWVRLPCRQSNKDQFNLQINKRSIILISISPKREFPSPVKVSFHIL